MIKIPVAKPDLSGNEEKYVVEAIRSTWISSTGSFVEKFEADFAAYTNARYALSVANGTVALHLALLALDIRPGDEVLVPSLTYISTANAVRYMGAEPVFVDVDKDTWCMDPDKIENAITRRTKAIIPVHLYGHPADMDRINHIAAVHGSWVVEDAAEAVGATYKGRPVGALGHIGTFSFFGNKIITSGEGGAVVVNDSNLHMRLKTLRGQGMDPERRYYFPVIGYNFRLTNVACALLCAQMERVSHLLQQRRKIYDAYESLLRDVPGLRLQTTSAAVTLAPWLFCLIVERDVFGADRDEVMKLLAENGVETRPFFIPIHTLPPYREDANRRGVHLPHTEKLAATGLNLPTYSGMSFDNIDSICRLLKS